MNVRRTDLPTVVLVCMLVPVLVMLSAGVPGAREPASVGAVVDFVRDHLPRIAGSVVQSDTDGILVALEGRPHPLRVTVSRRSVEVVDGERRVRRRRIGRADLVPEGDRLGRLRADTELRSRIRQGDRVTWTVDTLWLIREEGPDLADLKRRLAGVDRVEKVEHLPPGDDRASGLEEGAILLRFGPEEIVLKRVGELGELGRMSRYRAPRRPSGPRLQKAARFERRVYDFDWVVMPGRRDVRIVVLGGNNTLGLARWEDGPRRMHWHSMTGKVLSVSTLDRRARNPKALPILVVTKHQQDVKSHLYHYDMMERELTRRWSASRIWMRRVGDSVVGQTMGMNQPFDGSIYPILPREDGWSWGDAPDPKFEACSRLPSCWPLGGDLLNLTSGGRLNLVGEEERTRANGTFGGSPLWLSASRSQKKVDLHPQYTGWVRLDGPSAVLLPHNRYSGTGIIRALRSFDEATLHLLSVTEGEFETRWQSDRRTGFFTRVRGGPSAPWATLVDPETYHTTLYRIEGTDYPGW